MGDIQTMTKVLKLSRRELCDISRHYNFWYVMNGEYLAEAADYGTGSGKLNGHNHRPPG